LRKLFLLLVAFSLKLAAFSQYWQQEVNYTIDVKLNDKDNSLDAFEKIEYINNSPDTLHFIWFHLWPNAYKNDRTAYTDQTLENGSTKFYFSTKEDKGYINRLEFKVNNVTAVVEDHPQHIDIVKLILPSPLAPGQKTTITTPFHVQLPFNFSRGGHDGQSYQATQWYPKPAVYDKNGWHPMPYLDQGEFYSEFGSFDVTITAPAEYTIAATGVLQTKEANTVRYKLDRIHDFAWFADKNFIADHDTCRLPSGKVIDVFVYYTPKHKEIWRNGVNDAKKAVLHYSKLVGEYPYPVVQVVQGPESFGGGMEYPTITVISPVDNAKELSHVIAHELGHNWFYGILATNERDHPWMDEGMNSYYDALFIKQHYGPQPQLERILFETKAINKTDQPIELPAEKYSEVNYDLVAYYKTAEWMRYMEFQLGTETFNKGMQEYYRRWQFKHPQPEDFRKVMEDVAGKDLGEIFSYQSKKGTLPNQQRAGTRAAFVFDIKSLNKYAKNPSKNFILLGPALGYNSYDKLLAGVFVTNMMLPPAKFQFLAVPMYGTGSSELRGLGLAYYTFYPDHLFQKIELGISGSMFSMDRFVQNNGNKIILAFNKIVPGIKLTLKEKYARSNFNKYIQFKSFHIAEDQLRFDTSGGYSVHTDNRFLDQLNIVIENNRVLYPYRGELKIEQGNDFIRTAFTGNYFFNYVKQGGLNLRLFAGKFFYTAPKTFIKQFETDRYHLNMTGANGYEDYTYSDYFIGRNKFEGFGSQQIMVRDGGFKIRTDLLASKVGKTDDWLAAINLTSTIPKAIDPLSALPVKIPLKVFVDIGIYADAWKAESSQDRFLFDAGLQVSLFAETVNFYFPLVYSSVYRDYIQSTLEKKGRFWKKVSFSIDIANFSFRKIDRKLNF